MAWCLSSLAQSDRCAVMADQALLDKAKKLARKSLVQQQVRVSLAFYGGLGESLAPVGLEGIDRLLTRWLIAGGDG